jgi:hypothetical protein
LSGASGGGFAAVVTGIALLLVATMSPFTLLRLVPAMEAGAVAQLESARHRVQGAARAPVRSGGNLALDLARRGTSSQDAEALAETVGTVGSSGPDGGGAIPMVAGSAVAPEVVLAAAAAGAATSTVKDATGHATDDAAAVAGSGARRHAAGAGAGAGAGRDGAAGSEAAGVSEGGDAGVGGDSQDDARAATRSTTDHEDG